MQAGLGLLRTSASAVGYIVLVALLNYVAFHAILTAGVAAPKSGLRLRGLEAGVEGVGAPRAGSTLALTEIASDSHPPPTALLPFCEAQDRIWRPLLPLFRRPWQIRQRRRMA